MPNPKSVLRNLFRWPNALALAPKQLSASAVLIDVSDLGGGPTLSQIRHPYPPNTKGCRPLKHWARKIWRQLCPGRQFGHGGAPLRHDCCRCRAGHGCHRARNRLLCHRPPRSFLAKGVPIFCDVDESLHMDPTKLEPLITPRTVAIAPTHVMGSICDLAP